MTTKYGIFGSKSEQTFLLETLLSTDEDGWVNPFSERYKTLLSLSRTQQLIYENSIPPTTHSFTIYGTASLWHLIIACSDYIHPFEIPNRTLILLPSLGDMLEKVKEDNKSSLQGKTIIF